MIRGIPENIQNQVEKILSATEGKVMIEDFRFVGGGCINNGGKLITNKGDFFIKWNYKSKFKGMFEAEAKGLKILKKTESVYIPEVIATGEINEWMFLILEFVEMGRRSLNYWENLGTQLAILHHNTNIYFGLDNDNFIGSLPQFNSFNKSWKDFFIQERINKQIKMALDTGKISSRHVVMFETIYNKLNDIFPASEKPVLIHGDLWSGNLITNKFGDPCLIDPAVYYGNREIELSFTKLFGGFDARFYQVYQEVFPLELGFDQRVDIYNLYPLMVHVNLFGGHYLSQVESILKAFK